MAPFCGVEFSGVQLADALGRKLAALNDYPGHAREMHRITLSGEAIAA